MDKYRVYMMVTSKLPCNRVVEAESEEDAKQVAKEKVNIDRGGWPQIIQVVEVEQVGQVSGSSHE